MRRGVHRFVLDLRPGRIIAQVIVVLPVLRRPDRSWRETAAAVGADVRHDVLDAVGAEGALVAADAGIQSMRRQGFIAVFTGRSELKHGAFLWLAVLIVSIAITVLRVAKGAARLLCSFVDLFGAWCHLLFN